MKIKRAVPRILEIQYTILGKTYQHLTSNTHIQLQKIESVRTSKHTTATLAKVYWWDPKFPDIVKGIHGTIHLPLTYKVKEVSCL